MIGCLALYDFDMTQFDLKGWVNYEEVWMTENGYPPNTIGLPHSGKFLRYVNGKRRLEKEQYKVRDIDFYGGGEPGTDYAWKLTVCFSVDDQIIYLCFDEEVMCFSYEILEKLLLDLCQYCSPKYGIGFERERKYGPGPYAHGMPQGLKYDYENPEHGKQRQQIYKWVDVYRRKDGYHTGDFRDIYPFNVLSQPHLDRIVDGQRFQDWVQASADRGTLKQVSDALWTWWIEDDKIPAVRDALAPSGMILCL